jgi:hypothetical protein
MRKVLLVLGLLLTTGLGFGQTRNFKLVKQPSDNPTSQKRKAVVIGMSDYGAGRSLNNTLNDAADMAAVLTQLGFEVTLLKDNDQRTLKTNLTSWFQRIEGNDMAIFYFAGHGIEVNGTNYLIPVDADLNSETDVEYNTLNVNWLLGNLDEKKVGMKLLILDACRNNPFKRSWSRGSTSAGLAQLSAPKGTYIAFAASPGFTAQDGGNFNLKNGVFTYYLKQEILKEGVSIDEIFNNVTGAVAELTKDQQIPFKNSSLSRNFYFKPGKSNPVSPVAIEKYFFYVDQNGNESATHFSSRLEASNAMKAKNLYGKIFTNTGESFLVEAPLIPATPTPGNGGITEPSKPAPSNKRDNFDMPVVVNNFTEKDMTRVFQLYTDAFTQGTAAFNNKQWEESLRKFASAVQYVDIIIAKKWTSATISLDTTSILYTAYAAQNAQHLNIAEQYYRRLIDNNITHSGDGSSLVDIYKFVLINASNNNDKATFDYYLSLAKKRYTAEQWADYEAEFIAKNMNLTEQVNLYNRKKMAGQLTGSDCLSFGEVFVNAAKNTDGKLSAEQAAAMRERGIEAYQKAVALINNPLAAYNVGVLYYNDFIDYDDKIASNIKSMQLFNSSAKKTNEPANAPLQVLKDENAKLREKVVVVADNSIQYFETAYQILKSKKGTEALDKVESGVYQKVVDFLANLFAYKRDAVRGTDNKKFNEYDTKYKLYDALHGTN